jgi:hypothetical protein
MLRRHKAVAVFAMLVAPALSGCGTYVPNIQEFPGRPSQGREMVRQISHAVRCELTRAIIAVAGRKYPDGRRDPGTSQASFLDGWGAEVALTLNIDEKSVLSPNGVWIPSKIFSVGSGLSASAEANRIQKMNTFYNFDDLRNVDVVKACPENAPRDADSFLVKSDLKVFEGLSAEVVDVDLGEIGGITDFKNSFGKNVLQYEVSFDVNTNANVTPSWTLERASVNKSTLFSTSRDRKHDLLITAGPIDPTAKNPSLIPVAENLHFTAQFPTQSNITP